MASRRKTTKPKPATAPAPTPEPKPIEPKAIEPKEIPARSRVPAARSIFAAAGIPCVEGPEPATPWRIAGRWNYWPLSDRWAEDDCHPLSKLATGRQGYGARNLMTLVRDEANSPAALAAVADALAVTAPPTGPELPRTDCQRERVAR